MYFDVCFLTKEIRHRLKLHQFVMKHKLKKYGLKKNSAHVQLALQKPVNDLNEV